jgi:hypothetical protein
MQTREAILTTAWACGGKKNKSMFEKQSSVRTNEFLNFLCCNFTDYGAVATEFCNIHESGKTTVQKKRTKVIAKKKMRTVKLFSFRRRESNDYKG